MREIKFRAWDKKFSMIYSWDDLERLDIKADIFINSSNPVTESVEYKISEYLELMQFTGLKDKNGKEIYEGDILQCKKITRNDGLPDDPEVIEWPDAMTTILDYWEDIEDFEVIGNIYENKELLNANY